MPNLPFRPPPVVRRRPRLLPPVPRPGRPGALRSLLDEARRLPWFAISAAVHLCALAILASMIVRRPPPADELSGVFQVGLFAERPSAVETPPKPEPEKPKAEEPPPKPTEVKPTPKLEEPRPVPPEPDTPTPAPETETAAVKAAPILEVPGPGQPERDAFAARKPEAREEALREWGGTPGSERAVDAGLDWLARHQEPGTGQWADGDPQLRLAPGLTGLALLAFLGKGHSHTEPGPHRDTVARAVTHLLSIQASDGRFGEPYLLAGERHNRYLMYHQGIDAMALAEAYAVTHDPKLRDPVRRAVAYIERAQQDGGGWDYSDLRTGRNDTSVTGWQLMALKSAHAAGFAVNWQTLFGVMRHLDLYTNSAGEVAYANRDPGTWRRGPGMIAVGMLCYQMLGWPRDSAPLLDQANLLLQHLPDWTKANTFDAQDPNTALHTMYYWCYATLALFNMGGHWWQQWNGQLRELLIAQQRREGDRRGSWDPPARGFDAAGGRVYTTAINVLNLEIYYRYLPFYRCGAFDAVEALEQAARVRGIASTRRRALRILGGFRTERAQDILASALTDPDPAIRAIAQQELVEQRCERVVPSLLEQLESPSIFTRTQAIGRLESFGERRFIPHFIRALRDPERVVRDRAAAALRRLAGEFLEFRADADPEARERAVAAWEQWWRAENAQPPPDGIRGSVLVIDPKTPDAVVLDVGREKAVRRGVRFEIRRDDRVIATVQVEKVEPTLSVARILERRADAIREGDAVQSIPEPAVSRADERDGD